MSGVEIPRDPPQFSPCLSVPLIFPSAPSLSVCFVRPTVQLVVFGLCHMAKQYGSSVCKDGIGRPYTKLFLDRLSSKVGPLYTVCGIVSDFFTF